MCTKLYLHLSYWPIDWRILCLNIMPRIIHVAQSGFVPNRWISDNILLAQEHIHDYNKEGETTTAIKLDLRKAYDTMRWEYLIDLMKLRGFPSVYIQWVQTYITSPFFSTSINVALHWYFKSSRGLRQVDPFFPLLVCLGNEYIFLYDSGTNSWIQLQTPLEN